MEGSIPYDHSEKRTFNSGTSPNGKHMANWCTIQNVRELTDNWKETTVIKRWPSLLASGYWGFHRGKPVPFADWAPSWSRRLLGVSSRKTSVRWWGAIVDFWGARSRVRAGKAQTKNCRLIFNYGSPRSSASRIIQNGGHEKRTPGFLAEEKLQRLQVG